MNSKLISLASAVLVTAGLGLGVSSASADEPPARDVCAAAYVTAVKAANTQWREAGVGAITALRATQGSRKAAAKAKNAAFASAKAVRTASLREARSTLRLCLASAEPTPQPPTPVD